jgi:hypothetical protein
VQLLQHLQLVVRAQAARASSMPSSAATLATIGELSPDSSSVRQPRALQAASRAGRRRAGGRRGRTRPAAIAEQQPLARLIRHRRQARR